MPSVGPMPLAPGLHCARWTMRWARLREETDGTPTHFAAVAGAATRIDMAFVSLLVVVRTAIAEDRAVLFRSGLSDHVPLEVHMVVRSMLPAAARPLARSITRDKDFLENSPRTLELWGFAEWAVADKMSLYPLAARSAARIVRDRSWGAREGFESAVVVAVALAVSMQRCREARRLLENRLEAAEWLVLEGHTVGLRHPEAFADVVRRRRAADLDVAIRRDGGEGARRARRLVALRRVWAPIGQRRVLQSVRSGAGRTSLHTIGAGRCPRRTLGASRYVLGPPRASPLPSSGSPSARCAPSASPSSPPSSGHRRS